MKVITTKPIDRRARTEMAEEIVEAEVMSTSPSVHGRVGKVKEVWKEHETTKGKDAKGREP